MNVYEFEKTLLERMEESHNVLQCKGAPVPATDVREEWACHVELKIEPAGWQAIWKMNRATCEQYKIKYPTIVLGTVNNVYFQDLMADFSISMVQDDDVHLPEIHEVPLEDLWPTLDQENTELNIERTADCIDELRFFYRNVWMPWDFDSDDEADWCKKHLESRIRFCFDLKRDMSRGLADHIRKLIAEARYIQNKREIMELEMSDDEDAEEDSQKVDHFMRMQLRMLEIRNEIEMLENPVIRKTYEDVHIKVKSNSNAADKSNQKPNVYVVTMADTINKQMEYFESIKKMIGADEVVKCAPSPMDCFKTCKSRDHIYLPMGQHSIKLLEPLNSGGILKAAACMDENKALEFNIETSVPNDYTVLTTEETENVFVCFNGDYTIENVILDCRQARFGILIKAGTVTLKNCQLIGDRSSSTCIGIFITGNAKCVLENSFMQNFATGITCSADGSLLLNKTSIFNCGVALETEDTATIETKSSKMFNNSKYGIYLKTKMENIFAEDEKRKIVCDLVELQKLIPSFALNGDCTFDDNKKGNINIVDQKNHILLQHAEYLEDNHDESGFKKADVSLTNGKIPENVINLTPIIIDDDLDASCNNSFHNNTNNQSSHHCSMAEISIISID